MSEQKNKFKSNVNELIKELDKIKESSETPNLRVFQIAKILDVPHMDILQLLDSIHSPVSSHMSPVDLKTLNFIVDKIIMKDSDFIELNKKLLEMKKGLQEKERRKKEDEELKKRNKGVHKSNHGLAYSETLDEHMSFEEIKQDHICIDGEWFHEDAI